MPLARLAGACLTAASASLLVTDPVSAQRECRPSPLPVDLPAVDAIVDSAGIAALIAGSGTDGVLHFAIVADADRAPRAFPVAGVGGPPASEWLAPRIEELLRPADRSSTAWGVRLLVSVDSAPRLSLERSEYCPPSPKPNPLPRAISVRRRADDPSPQFPVYVVRISPDGGVRGVTFLRGDRDFHSQIRQHAAGMRYHPARIDGVPVASADTLGRR